MPPIRLDRPADSWASLYQKDPAAWTPACSKPDEELTTQERAEKERYEATRTQAEKESFGMALHETMDLWYAHQGTTVLLLTKLPAGSSRRVGYDDSGWTTYERCAAEQIKKFYMSEVEWKLVIDLGAAEGESRG